MIPVVGTFKSRAAAQRGVAELIPLQISQDRINLLTPETTDEELAAVPIVAGEQPGMGKTMGAVVGGSMGIAGGTALAPIIASFLIPGVGQVFAIGVVAATVLGAIGAAGGMAIGAALESGVFKGLPEDELFVYEDALRQGRTVLLVMADDDAREAVRGALELAGAETIDRAREMWWLGLRDVEKEQYTEHGANFDHDECDFRRGFEAALRLRNRNRSCEECYQELITDGNFSVHEREVFRHGFERGRQYLEAFRKRR